MTCEECRGHGRKYRIGAAGRSITCQGCGLTSHNLNDVRELFCGHCRIWHEPICTSCNGTGLQHCCDGPVGLAGDVTNRGPQP